MGTSMRLILTLLFVSSMFASIGYHRLDYIKSTGTTLAFEDHSIWYVQSRCRDIVKKWKRGQRIKIYPNLNDFTNELYPYAIENLDQDTPYILATLQIGPDKLSDNTTRIKYLEDQRIITSSPTHKLIKWHVEEKDLDMLATWDTHQSVIIGKNEGPFSSWYSTYEYILINVSKREWLRARPVK